MKPKLKLRKKRGVKPGPTGSTPSTKKADTVNTKNSINQPAASDKKKPVTTLEWANLYSEKGFSVIPICSGTKKPAIKWKKFQKQKATPEELREWFEIQKNGIAIVTGSISGLAVIDLDSEQAIDFATNNNLLDTPTVKTGKGFHLYCKYQEGIRNLQGRADLPDIDIRGDGGYVVAPPSIHETGHKYSWVNEKELNDLPLQEFPADLLLAQEPEDKESLKELFKGVKKGGRNNSCARLCGSLANNGFTQEEILKSLITWNEKNDPPMNPKEVEKVVESIYKKHQKEKKHGVRWGSTKDLIAYFKSDSFFFFSDTLKNAWVRFPVNNHLESHKIVSRDFKRFIHRVAWNKFDKALTGSVCKQVQGVLESRAIFDGPEFDLKIRVSWHEGDLWIDLLDDHRRAVRINKDGWELKNSEHVPIIFKN